MKLLKRQEWVVLSSSTGEYECHLGDKSLNKICFLTSLVLANKERLMWHMKFKGSLGCSNNEIRGVRDPQASEEGTQQAHYPGPQESRLGPLRNLLGRVPWNKALERRGAQENWLIFKDDVLQA